MIAALRTSVTLVALLAVIVGCSSERVETPPTTTNARVLALWERIPQSQKIEHSMFFEPPPYFGIVAEYESNAGREYRLIIDEITPSDAVKWRAFEAINFTERDQCGNPSVPVSDEIFSLSGSTLLSTLPDSTISRTALDEFLICPALPRLACRAVFSTDQFLVGTRVSRGDMCDWSALRAEIEGEVDLWFSEPE